MKMKTFAILDKAKPYTEIIRGLNLAAVMCTTVQMATGWTTEGSGFESRYG
jgi:hypothetical protein